MLEQLRAVAMRHGARVDAAEEQRRGRWIARASGIRLADPTDNGSAVPWSLEGRGVDEAAAELDLLAKLQEMPNA